MADQEEESEARPIESMSDIVDVLRHLWEALKDDPQSPSNDIGLMRAELRSIFEFLGLDL